ncbi:MAG TPA: LuxR C-terminal-related transcriptional regulator [Sulfuricurvum sp.]|nr:LuxR C-terminal-related transcriptional regulator [Sulfuricurvum sp.]
MKLYIISDDVSVRERWEKLLADSHPVSLSALSSDIKPQSILIILDRVIANTSEAELQEFFDHRVMILSMTPTFADAQRYLQLGAVGFGNAMMHKYHLHSAYQALEEGKVWLHPDFISLMISQIRDKNHAEEKSLTLLESLSKREQEVALMLGNGATHQNIADKLDITVRTVKAHASSIYQKLDVKDRLALSLLLHS